MCPSQKLSQLTRREQTCWMASFETNDVAVQRSVAVLLWTWNHEDRKGVVLRSVKRSKLAEQLKDDRDLLLPPAAPSIAKKDDTKNSDAFIRDAGEPSPRSRERVSAKAVGSAEATPIGGTAVQNDVQESRSAFRRGCPFWPRREMHDQVAAVRLASLIADEAAWRQREALLRENREKRQRAQHLCGGRFVRRTATGHLFALHCHSRSTTENSRVVRALKRERQVRARRHNAGSRRRAWSVD